MLMTIFINTLFCGSNWGLAVGVAVGGFAYPNVDKIIFKIRVTKICLAMFLIIQIDSFFVLEENTVFVFCSNILNKKQTCNITKKHIM